MKAQSWAEKLATLLAPHFSGTERGAAIRGLQSRMLFTDTTTSASFNKTLDELYGRHLIRDLGHLHQQALYNVTRTFPLRNLDASVKAREQELVMEAEAADEKAAAAAEEAEAADAKAREAQLQAEKMSEVAKKLEGVVAAAQQDLKSERETRKQAEAELKKQLAAVEEARQQAAAAERKRQEAEDKAVKAQEEATRRGGRRGNEVSLMMLMRMMAMQQQPQAQQMMSLQAMMPQLMDMGSPMQQQQPCMSSFGQGNRLASPYQPTHFVSNGSANGRPIQTGPKGGRFYINSKGNKSYV